MAPRIDGCDRVWESFASTGTTIQLGGALPNYRSVSSIPGIVTGDVIVGTACKGGEEICGKFTYTSGSPNTLAQTEIFFSSNGGLNGSAVSFSAGTNGQFFCDAPARWFDELNLAAVTVASATTCDIGAAQAAKIIISGTTTITSLGTTAHKRRFVKFSGALTLTHDATALILPDGRNIQTVAGATAIFLSDSTGNWTCWSYQRPSPVVGQQIFTASGTFTTPPGSTASTVYKYRQIGGGGGGGGANGNCAAGGGGGSGEYAEGTFTGVAASTGITITIGAAGAAGANTGGTGGTGGTTTIGSPVSITCVGGTGGAGSTSAGVGTVRGGAGGTGGTGSAVRAPGVEGGAGWSPTATAANAIGGPGGSSSLGGGGPGGSPATGAGIVGGGFGTGGGGAIYLAALGGAGKSGAVIIEWVL